jgi:endonuclease YncB( thermonuclease family)
VNDDFETPRPRRPRRDIQTVLVVVAGVAVLFVALTWHGTAGLEEGGWGLDVRRRGVSVELERPINEMLPTPTVAASGEPPPSGPSETGIPSRPLAAFALTVTYVSDGDTIEARVQTPNEVVTSANPVRIRLIGVDAPERTPPADCWADEARAYLTRLLPVGSTVWAVPDTETWDDYDRRLFYLWTDDDRFVNHELVAAGDAETMRIWPNVEHHELLAEAQAQAEASGAGRWGACG